MHQNKDIAYKKTNFESNASNKMLFSLDSSMYDWHLIKQNSSFTRKHETQMLNVNPSASCPQWAEMYQNKDIAKTGV